MSKQIRPRSLPRFVVIDDAASEPGDQGAGTDTDSCATEAAPGPQSFGVRAVASGAAIDARLVSVIAPLPIATAVLQNAAPIAAAAPAVNPRRPGPRERLIDLRHSRDDLVIDLPRRRKVLPGIDPGQVAPPQAPPPSGLTRSQLDVPVSPTPRPDDRTLFERPENAGQKLFVPRYRVGEEALAGGKRRFRVELSQDTAGGYLAVFLEKGPAPEPGAAELTTALPQVRLRYSPVEDLVFDEVTEEPGGILAVLRIVDGEALRKLQQIAGALKDHAAAPTLVVERDVTVAVPVAVAPEAPVVSAGAGVLRGTWIFDLDAGREGQAGDVWWEQQTKVARRMTPQAGAQIVALGPVDFDALTCAELQAQRYGGAPIDGSAIDPSGMVLQITPLGNPAAGVASPHPAGVWWDGARWSIYNENFAAMPEGAAFIVASSAPSDIHTVHRAGPGNLSGHMSDLDHPLANGNPNAIVLATHSWNPGGQGGVYNSHPIGVWYNGARWSIFNQDMQPMLDGAAFNVSVLLPGQGGVLIHQATAANTAGHLSEIDHPACNGQPDVRPLITPSWNPGGQGGVYNNHPTGVWYNQASGRWAIVNLDGQPMPGGAAFNVVLSTPATVHTAAAANIAGHCTFLDPAQHRVNMLATGAVFAVRTRGGNFAKVQVTEYGYNLGLRWVTYQPPTYPPGSQLYKVEALDLDQALDFYFDPLTNAQIYQRITGTVAAGGEWIQHRLRWSGDGKSYTYYQDALRRNVFKYFPDAFKLARRDGPTHTPWLDLIYDYAPDGVTVQVTLDYRALPYVSQERIEDAAAQLKASRAVGLGERDPVVFEPLPSPPGMRYLLKLPGALAQPREGALVHLERGISDTLTVPIEQFARLYTILAGESAATIEGVIEVEMQVGGGAQRESITFRPRLTDLVGEQFIYEVGSGPAPGTYSVQLRNATESALHVASPPPASLLRGAASVPATVESCEPPLPAELAPGASLTLLLRPSAELPGTGHLRPVLDLSGVTARFDKAATLRAITDGSVQPPYRRPVYVEATGVFAPPPLQDGQIALIIVDLGAGPDVRLTHAAPSSQGTVSLTAEEYILRRESDGTYPYTLTICRQGRQPQKVEGTDTGDTLLVYVDQAS